MDSKLRFELIESTEEYKLIYITNKNFGFLYEKFHNHIKFKNKILYPYNKKDFINFLLSSEDFKKINDLKIKGKIISTILTKKNIFKEIENVFIEYEKENFYSITLMNKKKNTYRYYFII